MTSDGLLADLRLHPADRAGLQPDVAQRLAGLAGGHHHQVLGGRQVGEFAGDLEGAQQAPGEQLVRLEAGDVGAVEEDLAAVGRQRAGDDVEERGLAGAVGADEAGDRAAGDIQRAIGDRLHAAEPLADGHSLDDHICCHTRAHCRPLPAGASKRNAGRSLPVTRPLA